MSNGANSESETVRDIVMRTMRACWLTVVVAYVCVVKADDIKTFTTDIYNNSSHKFQSSKIYFTDLWDEWLILPPMGMEMMISGHRRPLSDYILFVAIINVLLLLHGTAHVSKYVQTRVGFRIAPA